MYSLTKTICVTEDKKTITMYGITNGEKSFECLSSDKSMVLNLCNRCNNLDLSPSHFTYVIEDFINETVCGILEEKAP